jgi:hypothetical protein
MKTIVLLLLFSFPMLINAQHKEIVPTDGIGITVTIDYWTPSKGTAARYVEKTLKKFQRPDDDTPFTQGFLIILGRTDNGIWTVEGYDTDPEGILIAQMVLTDTAGNKSTFPLSNMKENAYDTWEDEVIAREKAYEYALHQMWRLNREGIWKKDELKPLHYVLTDYELDSDDKNKNDEDWVVIIQDRENNQLHYWDFDFTTTMCWHNYYWKGWTKSYDFASNE